MGGGLSGTNRASNNRGLGTGGATVPWTVRKGTRRATIPLRIVWKGTRRATIPPCLCDSRAPVGPRRHDGHGVCLWMVGGVVVRRSTPTPPPVRFKNFGAAAFPTNAPASHAHVVTARGVVGEMPHTMKELS